MCDFIDDCQNFKPECVGKRCFRCYLPGRKKKDKSHQASEVAVTLNDLLKGKLTKIAASLLKARLSDIEEDYPKRFPKHVLHDIERHNECLRMLACELIDLKRAV